MGSTRLTPRFTRPRDAADAADSGSTRVITCHAACHVLLKSELQMRAQLLVESIVELSCAKQRQETRDEDAERGHTRSSDDLANRPMIADVRDQFSASALSCFRPARLMV